jgi:hypothetical protein
VFKKYGQKWRHQGKATGIKKGRQEELLNGFAEGGGFLRDNDAVELVQKTPSRYDKRRIMSILKPEISRLRKVILTNLHHTHGIFDPLPRDKYGKAWQARIQIGYAVKNDEDRFEFKRYEQLTREERLDA